MVHDVHTCMVRIDAAEKSQRNGDNMASVRSLEPENERYFRNGHKIKLRGNAADRFRVTHSFQLTT